MTASDGDGVATEGSSRMATVMAAKEGNGGGNEATRTRGSDGGGGDGAATFEAAEFLPPLWEASERS